MDFEPEHAPFIEFDEPDFPWRFTPGPVTPGQADTEEGLLPAITLIALPVDDAVFTEGEPSAVGGKPWPWINVEDPSELPPDLSQAWRWAHVEVIAESDVSSEDIKARLRAASESVFSRLLCATSLKPGRAYRTFVVPTFEIDRKLLLGEGVDASTQALELSWQRGRSDPLRLPYRRGWSWEFRTGAPSDFKSLAGELKGRALTGIGLQKIDVSDPGCGVESVEREGDDHTLDIEGPLQSLDVEPTPWGLDGEDPPYKFRDDLAGLLSTKGERAPALGPPLYGEWHGRRSDLSDGNWFSELNLDPRHRVAAAYGAAVVRKHQDALMEAAWEQVGPDEQREQSERNAEFARSVSEERHARLDRLDLAAFLVMTSPLQARAPHEAVTVRETSHTGPIPQAVFDSAFRRIRSGPMARRQKRKHEPDNLLDRLNQSELRPAGGHPTPNGGGLVEDLRKTKQPPSLAEDSMSRATVEAEPSRSENEPKLQPKVFTADAIDRALDSNWTFGTDKGVGGALAGALSWLDPGTFSAPKPKPVSLTELYGNIRDKIASRGTSVSSREYHFASMAEAHDESASPPAAALSFDCPTFELLRELSQEVLLPKIETIPQNTFATFKVNQRFIEAYLTGLNHELARELRWRRYPNSQRSWFFRSFWQAEVPDILPAEDWRARRLGENGAARSPSLFLGIRCELLNRYPETMIYLEKKDRRDPPEYPVAYVRFPPDIVLIGFKLDDGDLYSEAGSWDLVFEGGVRDARFRARWEGKSAAEVANNALLTLDRVGHSLQDLIRGTELHEEIRG